MLELFLFHISHEFMGGYDTKNFDLTTLNMEFDLLFENFYLDRHFWTVEHWYFTWIFYET